MAKDEKNRNYNDNNNWPKELAGLIATVEDIDQQIGVLKEARRQPFKKAKDLGFHVPAMRQIIKERQEEPDLVANRLAALEDYREALADLADTPLGQAAIHAVE